MKYDRLTRFVKVDVEGAEYSLRLTTGMLEEIEDVLPKDETLVSIFLGDKTPKIKVMRKAFCIGLYKDGVRIKGGEADNVFQKYLDEYGVQELVNLFYVLVAASHLLGAKASEDILKGLDMTVKDPQIETEEKNA